MAQMRDRRLQANMLLRRKHCILISFYFSSLSVESFCGMPLNSRNINTFLSAGCYDSFLFGSMRFAELDLLQGFQPTSSKTNFKVKI